MSNFNNNLNPQMNQQMNSQMNQQMKQMREAFVTKSSIKWGIYLLIGILPMLISWLLFGGYDNSNSFFFGNGMPLIEISYGYQWLIAVSILIISVIISSILVLNAKEVKGDIYSGIVAWIFFLVNFWLFNIPIWVLFLVTGPAMLIAGYFVGTFIRFYSFVKKSQRDFQKLQNGDLSVLTKNMSEVEVNNLKKQFEAMEKSNPAFKNPFKTQAHNEHKKHNEIDFDKNNVDDVVDAPVEDKKKKK